LLDRKFNIIWNNEYCSKNHKKKSRISTYMIERERKMFQSTEELRNEDSQVSNFNFL
jgi:hypothetical protein